MKVPRFGIMAVSRKDAMDDEMQQLIKLLEEMGATEIEFKDEINNDACLSFMFGGKKAVIWGTGRNDETGGLFVEITPV